MAKAFCNKCGVDSEGTRSAVIDGVYYRHICQNCLNNGSIPLDGSYQRDRQREDNAKEMIQPYDEKGNISSNFAQAYPSESKNMFGSDKLKGVA